LIVGFQGEAFGRVASAVAACTVLAHHIGHIPAVSDSQGIYPRASRGWRGRFVFFALQEKKKKQYHPSESHELFVEHHTGASIGIFGLGGYFQPLLNVTESPYPP